MSQTITFSEYALGTTNPAFSFEDNTVTTNGVIVSDSAQPASPVLAANRSYLGPVFVYFENPVETVSVDVGYFDNLGSTRIEFRDAAGNVVASYDNTMLGVSTFSFSSELGIKSVAAIDYAFDAAGFSLDTVVFGPAVDMEAPPLVQYAAGPVIGDRDFGLVSASTYSFSDTLGPVDVVDYIRFSAEQAGTATFRTQLLDDPSKVSEFTLDFKEGLNAFAIRPDGEYDQTKAYTVTVSISFATSDKEKAMDDLIDDTLADILGSLIDYKGKQFELFEQLSKAVESAEDGAKLLAKFGKAMGVLGLALDIANRVDNISAAADPTRQTFIEFVDMMTGLGVTAGVGLGVSAVGTPVAGVIGGFAAGIVYTYGISDGVKDAAGDWYDGMAGGGTPDGLMLAQLAVAADGEPDLTAYTFDAEYYLATYADAREAVASGAAANAYFHYLNVGLQNGYKPNAEAEPIPADAISLLASNPDAAAGYHSSVFTQAVGELAGDAGSVIEFGFADYLNERRTDGTELDLDATLSALANRVARDWVANNAQSPHLAFDPAATTSWAETLSNNADFREALAGLLPGRDLSGLKIVAAFTEEQSPDAIFRALATSAEASSLLLGVQDTALGLAEFGGMWVLLLAPSAWGDALAAETSPAIVRIFGGEDQDVLFAGAAPALLDGGAGSDDLRGGAYDDVLRGGGGDDVLNGGGGSNELDGGEGYDVVNHANLGRRDGGAFSAGAEGTALHERADGGTDRLRAIEEVRFADGRVVFGADTAQAQAARLYDAAFDRVQDQLGLDYWTRQIEAGATVQDLAQGFAASAEFQAATAGLDNGAFVDHLYANAFSRTPDADGKAYWTAALDGGASRGDVLAQIVLSAEHDAAMKPVLQAGIWDVDESAVQVARLYDAVLGSLPDLEGLKAQVQAIGDGSATLLGVTESFMGTAAFKEIYDGLEDRAFVQALYDNILHREGEQTGVDYWSAQLPEGGMTRAELVLAFSESEEHRGLTWANTLDENQPGIAFA
ncbi:type I secretion target GGXGXDXXX repeat-containing domain protein [Acetobacteraceae bacterium AT-5844]|nr:type I secretion target GGXGXDXXX repeat-containing domain protein [Acetobacteraceae bacterium AT-5844]